MVDSATVPEVANRLLPPKGCLKPAKDVPRSGVPHVDQTIHGARGDGREASADPERATPAASRASAVQGGVVPPITPAPSICPSCPWRVKVTPTPAHVAAVRDATRTGDPQPCVSRGDRYIDTTCLPWLVTCGADNLVVVAAVACGELKVGRLVRGTNWPALHGSPGDVVAAVYRPPDRQRLDPLMAALREAREQAGLSQSDVARRLNIPATQIRDHEAGRRQPDLAHLRSYADCYGVDLAVTPRR